MPFAIPTLRDLVERARQSFRTNLPGSDAWLWPNNVNPTAKVIGGLTSEVFGFADYIARQRFVLTADGENLDLHGDMYAMPRRPAGPGAGTVTINHTDAISVAIGAVFQRSDGQNYIATAVVSMAGTGALDVPVIADVDGSTTNGIAGTPLAIVSGVTGLGAASATAAIGAAEIVGGVDIEDDETYRARILFRLRNPPHGGSAADYVLWASSVVGVTRTYVERTWAGSGTVRVFPIMDDLYPLTGGVPSNADAQRVKDYLNTVKPAGVLLTVGPPVALLIPHTITLVPNNTDVQAAVVAELRSAFRRYGRVAGNDVPHAGMPFLATPMEWSRSWSSQAIANAAGEFSHTMQAPAGNTTIPTGFMPVLGTVTFL